MRTQVPVQRSREQPQINLSAIFLSYPDRKMPSSLPQLSMIAVGAGAGAREPVALLAGYGSEGCLLYISRELFTCLTDHMRLFCGMGGSRCTKILIPWFSPSCAYLPLNSPLSSPVLLDRFLAGSFPSSNLSTPPFLRCLSLYWTPGALVALEPHCQYHRTKTRLHPFVSTYWNNHRGNVLQYRLMPPILAQIPATISVNRWDY